MQILPIPSDEELFGMGSTQISPSSLLPVMDNHDYDMVSNVEKENHLWQISVPLKDMQSFPILSICCHNIIIQNYIYRAC